MSLLFFIALLFLIRIFLRSQILELDEAEQVVMAQHLLPGYPNQPPLYSWLQYGFFKIFGLHLFSIALLKYGLIYGCLYCFHQICRLHCQNNLLAWCATCSWAFLPAISLDLVKDNTHSVLALFSACVTWYWFVTPSRLSKSMWYLIFGLIIGAGALAKFNYLLFLIILLISALTVEDYRKKLINSYSWLSIVVVLFMTFAYTSWLFSHSDTGLHAIYKLVPDDKKQWQGILDLTIGLVSFIVPSFVISTLFFPIKQLPKQQTVPNTLLIRYHLICLPFLATFVLMAGLRCFETRWLLPLLFLCPVLYFSQLTFRKEFLLGAKHFLRLCFLVQLILIAALVYRSHYGKRSEFPLNQMVETIKVEHQSIVHLVSDAHSYWLLGNLMMKLSLNQGWLIDSYQSLSELPKHNCLLVWEYTEPPQWVNYFIQSRPQSRFKLIENINNHMVMGGSVYLNRVNQATTSSQ